MAKFILEGEPDSLDFKSKDWKFEIVIQGVTWRLTEAEWGAFIVNMSELHKEYLEHHRLRRVENVENAREEVAKLINIDGFKKRG